MFSILHASGIRDLPGPIALCCHDAGAANLIAAWAAANAEREYKVCAEGPAHGIFVRVLPHSPLMPLRDALDGAACVLSGSGWASDLEHAARADARRADIPSLAVLDHWVNYQMRFVRGEQEVLPDGFVVTDPQAAVVAQEAFGNKRPILLWHNQYLEHEVACVAAASARQSSLSTSGRLLVVLEPIRADWTVNAVEPAEFRALDYLLNKLAALYPNPHQVTVRLRAHPSESFAKYSAWVERQQRTVEFSHTAVLAEDLAWADVVAGLHSYALVIAKAAGRRAVSYLPPDAPSCVLRYPGIERLVELAGCGS